MNPGICGAIVAICNQKKFIKKYKNTYCKSYNKQETKVVWKTHMSDLEKNGIEFLKRLDELKKYYRNESYLYVELFKLIKEYGQGFNKEVINLVCFGDYDFGLYERQIYENLKEKFESKKT